ncbi:MAG: NUDIX domain-containing protein [Actinobacteria bacterium]|nr:NUDIX domain-containing protein [Actinomycetota bacterium]
MNVRSDPFAVIPAAYVYLRSSRGVLLQLRQNTGYMDGCWAAGAAGHVERGETAAAAAIRELREELGVDVALEDLDPVAVMQRTDGTTDPREQRVDWFFTCRTWRGRPAILEPAKCGGLEWFPLDRLPERMPPHERVALDAVRQGASATLLSVGFDRPPRQP